LEWFSVIVIALLLAVGIRGFAVQAFYVPSGSMIPTLDIGDRILVDKLFFTAADVKRGAIVVFSHPPKDTMCGSPGEDLVKRVIATQGQTIWSKGNSIYINGKVISEPYLPPGTQLGSTPITRQTIPKGEVFLLGDNRSISCDSRYWGPIPTTLIIGQVFVTWWRSGHPDLHFY
jgi:signal peptidase I